MASYRDALPQLDGSVFLMDGGLETTLVFLEGLDLPCFAAFLFCSPPGTTRGSRVELRRGTWHTGRAPCLEREERPT